MTCGNRKRQPNSGGKNVLEVIDGQAKVLPPTPFPTAPKIYLHDAHAIRREMAAVYRDMRSKQIDTQEGTRLAYVLDMIRKAYETAVLEERLERVERTLEPRRK